MVLVQYEARPSGSIGKVRGFISKMETLTSNLPEKISNPIDEIEEVYVKLQAEIMRYLSGPTILELELKGARIYSQYSKKLPESEKTPQRAIRQGNKVLERI